MLGTRKHRSRLTPIPGTPIEQRSGRHVWGAHYVLIWVTTYTLASAEGWQAESCGDYGQGQGREADLIDPHFPSKCANLSGAVGYLEFAQWAAPGGAGGAWWRIAARGGVWRRVAAHGICDGVAQHQRSFGGVLETRQTDCYMCGCVRCKGNLSATQATLFARSHDSKSVCMPQGIPHTLNNHEGVPTRCGTVRPGLPSLALLTASLSRSTRSEWSSVTHRV